MREAQLLIPERSRDRAVEALRLYLQEAKDEICRAVAEDLIVKIRESATPIVDAQYLVCLKKILNFLHEKRLALQASADRKRWERFQELVEVIWDLFSKARPS